MRARISSLLWLYIGLIAFSCAGSFASARLHFDPGPIAPIASAATLMAGCAACVQIYMRRSGQAWAVFAVLLFGAAAELVGIDASFPFGAYQYTQKWAPVVGTPMGPFPLLVPFAWLLAALCCGLLASAFASGWLRFALAGGLAVVLDAAMEPVMAGRMDYWRWLAPSRLPGGAPARNFVAWFVLVSVSAALLTKAEKAGTRKEDWLAPAIVWAGQLLLMLVLGIA
jgi:uncharacterized membrane protein